MKKEGTAAITLRSVYYTFGSKSLKGLWIFAIAVIFLWIFTEGLNFFSIFLGILVAVTFVTISIMFIFTKDLNKRYLLSIKIGIFFMLIFSIVFYADSFMSYSLSDIERFIIDIIVATIFLVFFIVILIFYFKNKERLKKVKIVDYFSKK